MKEDFCAWWTPELIAEHNAEWLRAETYKELAKRTRAVMEEFNLFSVVELGCGAGHVGTALTGGTDKDFLYTGIDGSADMIDLARASNPGCYYEVGNIRALKPLCNDLVCTFAVLKHFSNEDFPEILKKVLACGQYGFFEMQIALTGPSLEDSNDTYWHTWTALDDLKKAIEAAGHELIRYNVYVPAGENKELAFVLTKRQ